MEHEDLTMALKEAQSFNPNLRDIGRVGVVYSSEANSALQAGAVILNTIAVRDDDIGDHFRLLVGLKRGTLVTPELSEVFGRPYNVPA